SPRRPYAGTPRSGTPPRARRWWRSLRAPSAEAPSRRAREGLRPARGWTPRPRGPTGTIPGARPRSRSGRLDRTADRLDQGRGVEGFGDVPDAGGHRRGVEGAGRAEHDRDRTDLR